MTLTVAAALAKTDALNTAFAAIGVSAPDTKMPKSRRNDEPFAYEVFCAKHLRRIAEARETKAVKEAVKAGVMFDHEKKPMAVGTTALVYAGEVVEIGVSVTAPATRLDADAFCAALVKAGMKEATVTRLRSASTVDNRAPHKFVATLCTT